MSDTSEPNVKCLLVDDREDNLLVLTALLEQDGVEFLTARSGLEALELLLANDVALALLDVHMPDMDGFELAELMRGSERTRHVPLIFVTAGAHDHMRQFRGYDHGAVDFLYKPIEAHVLRSKAGVFFQLHRQQRQLARELHARTETLRMNELFVAALGHDLRNPLNAIVASAQYLSFASTDASATAAAGRIVSSGLRMSRMIKDMLDLARARLAGGIDVSRATADLGDIVEKVAEELRSVAGDKRIEVAAEGDLRGEWDADHLARVVSNLIGNALTHGDRGEPVRVRIDGSAPRVVLTVSNRGVIPASRRANLFDPFHAHESAPGRRDGLGLGLFIVQALVLAHGGAIDVRSEAAEGTTFRVELPRGAG